MAQDGHLRKMKRRATNFAGWLFTGLGWVFSILSELMDWVGRSTVIDDGRQLLFEKLPAIANILESAPTWAFAVPTFVLTIWMMWLTWRANKKHFVDQSDKIENKTIIVPSRTYQANNDFLIDMTEVVTILNDHLNYPHFTNSMRMFLQSGQIAAFGRPMVGSWEHSPNHGLGEEEQISTSYWENADIQWTSYQVSAKTHHFKGGIEYAKLNFVRPDFMACFFGPNWETTYRRNS